MTTLAINIPITDQISDSRTRKVFLSAYICNMLEMYDFLITGMMFPYISQFFFPLQDKISLLLAGSLTFLVGFLMRPLGGILFGYIGDTYGRKKALLLTVFGMAFSTVAMGLLPTYSSISFWAPLLFVLLRMIQGLCIGGEGQGANVFVLEHYRGIKPGTKGGLLATSNGMAALLAFFISMFVTSNEASGESWRICYLFGGSLGLVGLYLRSFINESPAFNLPSSQRTDRNFPLLQILKKRKLNVLNIILCVGLAVSLTYTGFTFVNLFLSQFLNFSPSSSLSYAAFGTILTMGAVYLGGQVCDKIGLFRTLNASLITLIILIFPIHWLLATGETSAIILALILFAIASGGMHGCGPHLVASSFPTRERYTGAAFSNNMAQALLGGVQPFLAIYLIKLTDVLWSPALYTCFLACVYWGFLKVFKNKLKSFEYVTTEGDEK